MPGAADNPPGTADPVGDGSAAGGVGLAIAAGDLMAPRALIIIEEEEGNTVKSAGLRDPAAARGLQVELVATEMRNGTEEAVSCPEEKRASVENVNINLIGGSGRARVAVGLPAGTESSGSVPHARSVVGETEAGGRSAVGTDGSVSQEGDPVHGEEVGKTEPVPIGDMVQNRDIHALYKNPMGMGDFTTLGADAAAGVVLMDAVSGGEECWFDDDLLGPGDFAMADVGRANVLVDRTSKNADTLLVDENVMGKGVAFMADAGSVAVASAVVGSQSKDTRLIEEKSNDNSLVTSTSCSVVETRTHTLQPIDENLTVKGDCEEEEPISTPETSEPSEIRAIALKGNQSSDMLISYNQDTVRFVDADVHGVGSTEAESGDPHLVNDDLMEPGDFVTVNVSSASDLPDKRLQKADTHLVDENVIVKHDTSMEDAGSVAIASAISPKRQDSHPIEENNYDNYLVTSTSCLVIESEARVTQPIDENLMVKGDFEDELIPIVKGSMPETSEPLEIRASAIEGKCSFDFLIPVSKETAALSTISLANGNDGADAHGLESSEAVSGDESGVSATADLVSANAFVDKTSQNADMLLVDENAVVEDDISMTNAGSVAVTPSVSSKREDTPLIDEKNYDNYYSTSCLVVESRSGVTQPIDVNYTVKEDFEEELIPVAKTSMPEMSEPSEIRARAFQENQSFDLLIADNQDTGARSTDSLTIGNIGADAHALESSEAVIGDGCLVTDDLMGPRGFGVADANIVEDKTSQNAENHLANEKGDTFMAEAGLVVVAPVLASQIEDTHLIDVKIKDTFLVSGTSCLMVETQATVTHPFNDNLTEKGDYVEVVIPVAKTSMTMMSGPSETRIPAFQGNQSFDLLIGDNQDTDSHSMGAVSEERCLVNDDLTGPGDCVMANGGSAKVVADVTSQNSNIHLVDGTVMVKSDTSLVDEGSVAVAVAPAVSSQSEDTCMIDIKAHGDCPFTSASCLVVETQSTATSPLDDNLIKKGELVEELIPSVKTIMLDTLKPPEIRAITFQGNQSCDLLTPDNVDTGDFPTGSFINGDSGTDAHNVESSLGSDRMVVESGRFMESLPMPDKLEVQLVQRSEAEGSTSAECDSMTDVIVDASALHIGEQELLESSEKQILQREPVVPWTKYAESNRPVRYNLPPQDTKFSVSDLVWGKVRSHPWWPGQIFDHSDASDLALKHQKKDNFLVAYFEDRTFAWRDKSQLKPFYTNFSQMEKQSNSEAFKYAIMEVLGEASRRMELGMTCSCFPEEYAAKKCQEVVNAGVREGTDNSFFDRSLVMNFFQPSRHLEYIKALAQIPIAGADRLELVIAKAQLKAFYHSKGYCELPEFVVGGLIENDIEVSASCEQKPTDVAPDHSTLLSSELLPGKRKRGRPPKQQKHISGEISSSDNKPTEAAVEHSTLLSSELLPRKQRGGRPSKKHKYMAEEISPSSDKILIDIETTVKYSTPLSSELVPGKRKRGRPSKKQKDIFLEISTSSDKKPTETTVEHSTPLLSELVPGKRKRGRPSKKQKDIFGDISTLQSTETALEHTLLSSELVPRKQKRGRPPKKQEHISEDCRKQESSSEEMEEINVSCGGKSGSGVKSAGFLNLCSSGKKCRVVNSGSAELGKTKKKRLDSLNDLGTKLASPNLGRSFNVEESLENPGENKRKNDSVSGLGTKSSALGSSFKVGEYIRRVASQLTGSPPIFKCHDEAFQKSVSKADRRGGGVNMDTLSQNMRKRKTKKGISGDYSSADELLSKLFRAARDPLEGYSFLSVLVSFFTDFRNSCASGSSEASVHSAKMGDKRDGKEAFDSDSADSDTSTPDHMKDSYWSDMISDKSSGKGLLSSGLKRKGETDMQKQRKKKKLIGESSPSYLLGETARHLQLGTLCPNMKPALASERSIISVEEKIVDTPTSLVLSFSSSDYLPSEADLFRIFGSYGPLRESELEILRKTKCVKVVFKRRADAETAFSSAGKFSIFGPALVSYQLKYSPSTPETSSDYSPQGTNEVASTKVGTLEASAQAETGLGSTSEVQTAAKGD